MSKRQGLQETHTSMTITHTHIGDHEKVYSRREEVAPTEPERRELRKVIGSIAGVEAVQILRYGVKVLKSPSYDWGETDGGGGIDGAVETAIGAIEGKEKI